MEHGTADTSLHLLCLASSPLFFFPLPGTRWQKIWGSQKGVEIASKDVGPKKGWTKGTLCFSFSLSGPSSWDAVALLSSGTIISLLSAALEFHSCRLVFPGPWQQLCFASVPQEQQWRWASVLRTLFSLVVQWNLLSTSLFSRPFFCSPLLALSIRGGYFGISVYMTSYMARYQLSGLPGPSLARVIGMGSPCRQSVL